MVAVGETDLEPEAATVVPSKVTVVALVDTQESVLDWPEVTEVGEARKEEIVGKVTTGGVTVTVIVFETVEAPVATKLYVVVDGGVTVLEPLVATETLSKVTLVALVVDQDKVDDWPWVMAAGLAEKVAVVTGVTTLTVTCLVTVPVTLTATRV